MQTKPHPLAADSRPTDAAPALDAALAPPLEWLSALLDGACPPERVAQATAARAGSDDADASADLYADWSRYHWIGEALRGSTARLVPPASPAFADAVLARLALEPAPALSPVHAAPAPTVPPQAAANDAVFRWKMVAGLASVATVAALSWSFLSGDVATGNGQQWAQAPAPQAQAVAVQADDLAGLQGVVTAKGLMWRDPQLDALLAAHRQHGGINALHVPVGFLRNATYDHSAP